MASSGLRSVAIDSVTENTSDNKLKYAIMFGAPLVASIALFWYLRRQRQEPSKKVPDKKKVDGRADAQRRIQDQIDSKDPIQKATGYKNKGNNLYKVEKYKEAIECYTEAIKVCPVDKAEMLATFYQNRAAAYELLNMTDNVISDCTKALELNKKYSKAYYRRAKAYEQKGELRKCCEDTTCCLILERFSHANALALGDKAIKAYGAEKAKEILPSRKPELPSSAFIRNYIRSFIEDPILADLTAKRNNEALQTRDPPSGYDMALQAIIEEKWDEIDTHCEDEISRDHNKEKVDKALILRAGFRIMAGRVAEAQVDVDNVLARENVNVKVRVNALIKKATAEIHRENADKALETFEEAKKLDPNNADVYLHKGQVLLLLDKLDEVIKNLEIASNLRPDFPSAAAQLAFTQYRYGARFQDKQLQEEAMRKFDECMEKFPDFSEVYFLYYQLMIDLGKHEEAEKYLNTFIEKDPGDATGLAHIGVLALQAHNDVPKAIEYLQKAINLDPKCQFAYETLGTLLLQSHQYEDGMALLDKGLSLSQTEFEIASLASLKLSGEVQQLAIQRLGEQAFMLPS